MTEYVIVLITAQGGLMMVKNSKGGFLAHKPAGVGRALASKPAETKG
jgi:hypothetical protein